MTADMLDLNEEDIGKASIAHAKNSMLAHITCPLAQALRRKFPEAKHVVVMGSMIHVDDRRFRVTQVMERFVDDWDNDHIAIPRRFRLFPLERNA